MKMAVRFVAATPVALALALSAALPGSAASQEKVKISIGHIATLNTPAVRAALVPLRDALEATGKVEVTMYGSGSPYSNPSRFSELVEKGVLDIANIIQQYEASRYKLNLLIGEPLLVDDHVKGTRAYFKQVKSTEALAAEFKPNHIMMVALAAGEQIHARKQVRSIDDLKGMRVLVSNPGVMAILREVGASVVALPAPAQYENLQKGVVDATSQSWQGTVSWKLLEVTSYHFEFNSVATPVGTVINQKKYESLPPEVRKVIDDFSGEKEAVRWAEIWTVNSKAARDEAQRLKHEIVTISPEARRALKERFKHVTDGRVAELEKTGAPARKIYEALAKAIEAEEAVR